MNKQRNSNVELLRIICMFCIVIHHFMAHGGLWMLPTGLNKAIVNFFLPFGKIGFDTFVAISCWFLVNSSFKGSKFLKIWLQVLFYNVLFTILAMLWYDIVVGNPQIGKRILMGSFLPMLGNSHGFAAAYLVFYLLLPVLKKIQTGLNRRQTLVIICILGATQCILPVVAFVVQYTQPMQSEFLLFVLAYYVAYYLQNWPIEFFKPLRTRIIATLIILTAVLSNSIVSQYIAHPIVSLVQNVCSTEFSVINLILGFLLLSLFRDVKVPYSPAINFIASTTFGVLLFHDHNYLRPLFWEPFKNLLIWETINPILFGIVILLVAACVFLLGMLVELFRQVCFESWITKNKFIKNAGYYLDELTDFSDEKN